MEKILRKNDIGSLEKQYRTNLINGLHGFKSAMLIGTQNLEGLTNLALFSQVIHIGANPAMMGILHRPVSVEKHTYENIMATHQFTINHVPLEMYKQAHHTSARYERTESEFEHAGFHPYYSSQLIAPYVAESPIKIGLSLAEIIPVKSNNTLLIVGSIEEIIIDDSALCEEGFIDLDQTKTALVHGLETYYKAEKIERLAYAKPHKK
ncbi:MAG: flavin reductase [Bacteroidia bacterium]|nr:flavin reductase [Bacteroidia bacterium]